MNNFIELKEWEGSVEEFNSALNLSCTTTPIVDIGPGAVVKHCMEVTTKTPLFLAAGKLYRTYEEAANSVSLEFQTERVKSVIHVNFIVANLAALKRMSKAEAKRRGELYTKLALGRLLKVAPIEALHKWERAKLIEVHAELTVIGLDVKYLSRLTDNEIIKAIKL